MRRLLLFWTCLWPLVLLIAAPIEYQEPYTLSWN